MKKYKRKQTTVNNSTETQDPEYNMKSNNDPELPAEGEPSKKRKKKITENPLGEDGKPISNRKLKKERHAQRMAEADAASHKVVMMQALSYLSLWKYNKNEWKFNKVKQSWLYKHKFDTDKIPDELWQAFIEYFAKATGGIKNLLIQDSNKVIEEMETWTEKNKDVENPKDKPSELGYTRARDILQNITDE